MPVFPPAPPPDCPPARLATYPCVFRSSPNCPKENPRCFCPITKGEEVLNVLGFDPDFTAVHNLL